MQRIISARMLGYQQQFRGSIWESRHCAEPVKTEVSGREGDRFSPCAWAAHALSPQNVLYGTELVINGSGIIEKTLGRFMPEHKQ